jgi:hypothetical protein
MLQCFSIVLLQFQALKALLDNRNNTYGHVDQAQDQSALARIGKRNQDLRTLRATEHRE